MLFQRLFVPLLLFSSGVSAQRRRQQEENYLELSADNVHWGYFSKTLEPRLTISSGSEVTVEMATHHGCDDWENMIAGDPGRYSLHAVQ